MVPIHPYYLGASSSTPISSAPFSRPQSMSQVTLPHSPSSRSPVANKAANRQSMPAQRSNTNLPGSPPGSSFIGQNQSHQAIKPIEPTPEEGSEEEDLEGPKSIEERFDETDEEEAERAGRPRKGTMSKNYKFPPPSDSAPPPPVPALPPSISVSHTPPPKESQPQPKEPSQTQTRPTHTSTETEDASLSAVPTIITPSAVEVPPPPPVEKERSLVVNDGDDDLGETEEISLS